MIPFYQHILQLLFRGVCILVWIHFNKEVSDNEVTTSAEQANCHLVKLYNQVNVINQQHQIQ